MSDVILDASAILALLQKEKGHQEVEQLLLAGPCAICTVNLTEVITRLMDNGMSFPEACEAVRLPNLHLKSFDAPLAQIAASLRSVTRPLGLSLADRACLALARTAGAADVYTADTIWNQLSIANIAIHVIR